VTSQGDWTSWQNSFHLPSFEVFNFPYLLSAFPPQPSTAFLGRARKKSSAVMTVPVETKARFEEKALSIGESGSSFQGGPCPVAMKLVKLNESRYDLPRIAAIGGVPASTTKAIDRGNIPRGPEGLRSLSRLRRLLLPASTSGSVFCFVLSPYSQFFKLDTRRRSPS
jgi:hypothetical protein